MLFKVRRLSADCVEECRRGANALWESVMRPKGIARFVRARSGVTSIEYALIAVIVVVGIVAGVTSLSDSVGAHYDLIASSFSDL